MPKLVHYRSKCIGCNICFEMQPEYWRLSKKDGKATLVHSVLKKTTHILEIPEFARALSMQVVESCPVNIIKVME